MTDAVELMILRGMTLLFLVAGLLPLWKTHYWWVRSLDFPRFQLLVVQLIVLMGYLIISPLDSPLDIACQLLLGVMVVLDIYRIHPYTPFVKPESPNYHKPRNGEHRQLTFLSANVYQKNRDSDELLKLINKRQPDFVFLVETDSRWKRSLEPLQEHWPYSVLHPKENSYGFLFFSKYPIEEFEIKHLVDDRVPSLFARCRFHEGSSLEFIGLHPRPPRPVEGHSHERDGELIQVANYVRKSKRNFIVAGDLNDVAWSHSTRTFRRVSGLWDPRIGRGIYATFPRALPYLRFPLDHFFHSSGFRLVTMERLGDVGSDHLPIYLRLAHVDREGETNEISESLKDESRRYQQKAEEWDGPNNVITPDRV